MTMPAAGLCNSTALLEPHLCVAWLAVLLVLLLVKASQT
jgi:hypothetical protein